MGGHESDWPGADVGGSNPGFGLYADRLAKTDWNEGVVVESVPNVEDTDDEVVDEDAKTDIDAWDVGDEDDGGGDDGEPDDVTAAMAAMAAAARAAGCIPPLKEVVDGGNICVWTGGKGGGTIGCGVGTDSGGGTGKGGARIGVESPGWASRKGFDRPAIYMTCHDLTRIDVWHTIVERMQQES